LLGLAYLWVALDALHRLLLRLAIPCGVLCLQGLGLLLLDLTSVLATLVVLHGLGARVDALVVLLHDKVGLGLAQVRADELDVALDGLVAVLDRRGEGEQLDEASSAVRVSSGVIGRALDHLAVGLNSSRPVCLLELGIAELTGLLCLLWVDVRVTLCLDLGLLCCTKLCENLGCAVLSLSLLIKQNCVGEVVLLLVSGTDTSISPGTC
jgi:hypothetical protein